MAPSRKHSKPNLAINTEDANSRTCIAFQYENSSFTSTLSNPTLFTATPSALTPFLSTLFAPPLTLVTHDFTPNFKPLEAVKSTQSKNTSDSKSRIPHLWRHDKRIKEITKTNLQASYGIMVTSTRQLLVETMEIYDEPNKSHNNSDTSLATTEGSRQNSANHSPSTPCNSHSPRLGLKASFSGNNLRAIAGNFVAQSPESGYFSSAPGYPNIFHPIAALRPGVDLSAANNEDSVFGNVVQTSTPTNKMHKPALRPTATPRAALPLLAAPNQKDGVLENVIKTGTRAYKIRKTGLPSRAPRKPELKLLAPINEEDDVFGNVMPTSSLAIKIRKESNRDFQNLFKIDKPSSAKDKDMGL